MLDGSSLGIGTNGVAASDNSCDVGQFGQGAFSVLSFPGLITEIFAWDYAFSDGDIASLIADSRQMLIPPGPAPAPAGVNPIMMGNNL